MRLGWSVAPWWLCLAGMKNNHDGGGADDVNEDERPVDW